MATMTTPISPAAGVVPSPPASPQATPSETASAVRVDVSRAATAPIYVYRVIDTATGRTLVEIPTQQAAEAEDIPGRQLDARA